MKFLKKCFICNPIFKNYSSPRKNYYHRSPETVSYTHLRAHETVLDLVCRLLLEKKNNFFSVTLPLYIFLLCFHLCVYIV
ncbi:hypothetical protein PVA38_12455 [Streptococcus pneumoniae D39]|nr:hypothetical protein PVA38_12455 [Streptococcus pneumoniae D39]